jgi:hypothetical protein
VSEWSGGLTVDGSPQSNEGTSADYSTASISTTGPGLVVMVTGDYAGLSGLSGTPGDPDFTVTQQVSDSVMWHYISGSAQTVTPGGSATGNAQWVAIAQAFKDAATAAAKGLTTLGVGN